MKKLQDIISIKGIAYLSRLRTLEVAKRESGAHIGGIFSIIDFISTYYFYLIKKNKSTFKKIHKSNYEFVFSKGHCYLAQLCVLDVLNKNNFYTNNYLKKNSVFFGHPKRIENNKNFLISSGSLGQGIVYANGLAYANKRLKNNNKIITLIGDGELNEGSCVEAMLFNSHHQINHTIVIDYNDQMSLDKTSNILSLGNLKKRLTSYGLKTIILNGHNINELTNVVKNILLNNNKKFSIPTAIVLKTIKGKGIKFMEGQIKWHHRRFKNDEYNQSIKDLYK